MNAAFWIAAALLVLAALAFVLPPLLRRERSAAPDALQALEAARATGVLSDEEYHAKRAALPAPAAAPAARPAGAAAVVLLMVLPLATWLLYREVGEPRALQAGAAAPTAAAGPADAPVPAPPGSEGNAPTLEQAAAGLAERMRQSPDDLGGWMLLGRAYKTLQRFDEAREALSNAYRLAPEDPDVLVEYAEALTLAANARIIEGEPAALLDRALALQPDHQRGLWLKGIQAYQQDDFAQAAATWQRLRDLLPAEAEVRASLDERIREARGKAGLPALAAGTSPAPSPDAAPSGAADGGRQLQVEVDIAPALKARLRPSDVLFVFARAPDGPRMPVAIRRLPASGLPLTVTLDESTSMTPQMTLATLPEVVVGARVSRSGDAAPQPGDLQAFSDPVPTSGGATVRLLIDTVVE